MPIKGITSSDLDGFISNKCLTDYDQGGDVEELLGSPSPVRARSSSLRGRPPQIPHTSILRSSSPSFISRRQAYSPEVVSSKDSKDQQHWALELSNSVVEYKDKIENGVGDSSGTMMYQNVYDKSGIMASPRLPFKADHSMSASLYGTYSRLSPSSTRSSHLTPDDIKSRVTQRINRSRSLSRLNESVNKESTSLTNNQHGPHILHQSLQELQSALENSESQRRILMDKLKETQASLELQSERLTEIESSAKDNSVLVENLKLKELQYRKTISQFEVSEEEKQMLRLENLQLREEMQNRINALDYQLKHLKSQHHSSENKNSKNSKLLDHTTIALSLLEEENSKMHQDKEKLQSELLLIKESLDLAKTRYCALEAENRSVRNDSVKLKEENVTLSKKVQEMAGQMIELRSLLTAVRDENERIFATLKASTEDKSQTVIQIQGYQDTISDLKNRFSSTSADRDRLFLEKLDMNSKLQQMMLEQEHLMKTKLNLDEQLSEQMSQQSHTQATEHQTNVEGIELAKEVAAVNKVKDELSAEITLVKKSYKHVIEQMAALEMDKTLLQTQYDLSEQEKSQLKEEANRIKQMFDTQSQEKKQDREKQDEIIHSLRSELKHVNSEKSNLESRIQKLTAENTKIKDSLGDQFTTDQSDKLHKDFEQLQAEYNNLKDEYGSLVSKHQQFVTNYGHDEEILEKEKQEMVRLKKEKDAVQKQVAFLQGQMLLMEGSKKRADEHIYKLTSEVEQLQAQLKENSKIESLSPEEVNSLRQEIVMFKQQLDKANEDQRIHNDLIENLRENDSQDMRSELQQAKDKLQDLLEETEQKNQTIEDLKLELKSSKETDDAKQLELQELCKAMEELKKENHKLCQDLQTVQNSVIAVSQESEQQTLKNANAVKTLQEELLEAIRSKQTDSLGRMDNSFLSKSLDLQHQSSTPVSQVPIKSTKDSNQMKNLMYNSCLEHDETSLQQAVNSLPGYKPFKLLSKSWGPAPKASVWRRSSTGSSPETASFQSSQSKTLTPARKLPPPPPPKPSSFSIKSSFMPSLSSENFSGDGAEKSITFTESSITSSSVIQPALPSVSSSTSLSSFGQDKSAFNTEDQSDSQEQRDISLLIHKFDEMAAF